MKRKKKLGETSQTMEGFYSIISETGLSRSNARKDDDDDDDDDDDECWYILMVTYHG
jgi:hypothetical protein